LNALVWQSTGQRHTIRAQVTSLGPVSFVAFVLLIVILAVAGIALLVGAALVGIAAAGIFIAGGIVAPSISPLMNHVGPFGTYTGYAKPNSVGANYLDRADEWDMRVYPCISALPATKKLAHRPHNQVFSLFWWLRVSAYIIQNSAHGLWCVTYLTLLGPLRSYITDHASPLLAWINS